MPTYPGKGERNVMNVVNTCIDSSKPGEADEYDDLLSLCGVNVWVREVWEGLVRGIGGCTGQRQVHMSRFRAFKLSRKKVQKNKNKHKVK